MDDEWWQYLDKLYIQDEIAFETMAVFHELVDCHNIAVSLEYLVKDIWNYLMDMIEQGEESRVITKGKETLKLIDQICGRFISNVDVLASITQYIDDLEDGIYWEHVLDKANETIDEEENG